MKRLWIFLLLMSFLAACGGEKETATCEVKPTISVYNAAAEETIFQEKSVCLKEGETVLDALKATGLSIESSGNGDMAYVTAIEGVAEKSEGQASAWVYALNGTPGDEGAGAKKVKSTDVIQWRFEKDAMAFFE